jgi:hypothetical protein
MKVTFTISADDFEGRAVLEIRPEDSPEKVKIALAEAGELLSDSFRHQFPQYKTPRDIAMASLVPLAV